MKGHTYQRGKTWTYVVDLTPDPTTGERRQKSKGGFRTEGEAEAACAEFITKVNKGLYVEDTNMTLAAFLELYLETHIEPNYKPTAYDVERTVIEKRIIPAMGKIKLQQLTPIAITQFYTRLRKEYSSEYVKNIHSTLRRALRQAYRWDILPTNIMEKVSTPKVEKKEMQFWTLEECQRFLQAAEGHVHYIIYALAIHTGMRRGEVLGLRWKDIDYERKTITVVQTVNWTSSGVIIQSPKTKTSSRQIAVGDSLLKALKVRHKQVKEDTLRLGRDYHNHDLVCCYENGEPMKPKRITESFAVLTKRSGLNKIRFHDLRHSHASMLLKMGVNAKVGAERLGHSNVQIFLDRYSHLTESMQRDAVDLFESEMSYSEISASKSVDK